MDRVGGGGLCPPEPERGGVWGPFEGPHYNQLPAIIILATRKVGDMTEERVSGSSPTASMFFHRSSKLAEMVISLTGKARSPFSIQKPPAPWEKSPVTALKPKPMS